MIGAGVRGTPTPNPSPQGGGELERRACLLPSPLRGRVGEGGPQRRSEFGAAPSPTPPRKGEGSGESPRKIRETQRKRQGSLPPA